MRRRNALSLFFLVFFKLSFDNLLVILVEESLEERFVFVLLVLILLRGRSYQAETQLSKDLSILLGGKLSLLKPLFCFEIIPWKSKGKVLRKINETYKR
jgi:hypothetical protein